MTYKQITSEERYTIYALRKQGMSLCYIAKILGRHRCTIGREIKRNASPSHGAYEADRADARSRTRRSKSRRNARFTPSDFAKVENLLKDDWSPEQISGTLRTADVLCISHETIYRYVWSDMANGGTLWKHLRQSTKQRRKRYKSYDSRGRLANKRMIGKRPPSIDLRKTMGHWEIDTVHGRGSNHCIVTLVERKSGYLLIGKLPDKSTDSLNSRVKLLLDRYAGDFKTITADNGTEFHQYKKLEEYSGTTFYFANPHHSWERGTNENANGLIRQYLPKTKSMFSLTQQECNSIANKLNNRPRKRHDFKTPKEIFYDL
jgi:IS30 family transposase